VCAGESILSTWIFDVYSTIGINLHKTVGDPKAPMLHFTVNGIAQYMIQAIA
jgi:hypothetical protein